MTDVRLTALNPEDSTVVPVACNSSGELLVDKGTQGPDLNVEGSITAAGNASFGSSDAATYLSCTSNGESTIYAANSFDGKRAVFTGANKDALYTSYIFNDGSAVFAGEASFASGAVNASLVSNEGRLNVRRTAAGKAFSVLNSSTSNESVTILGDGSADFKGDLVVGSRSKSWMLVEQGGLCHMVEQTRSLIDEGFSVDDDADADDYPKLRDVFNELDLIEKSLSQVMEKLRLTPPAGWPVWDGSDETQ
jgi:hypothetical protein